MATYTSNYNLKKPAANENYSVNDSNGNMDSIDTALNGLGSGLAIIANGNTHAAVTKGQFVYVHGHGTLAEGLYKASSNIAANATLSSSNLTAVSGGLGAEVAALNSNFTIHTNSRIGDGIEWGSYYQTIGKTVSLSAIMNLYVPVDTTTEITSSALPVEKIRVYLPVVDSSSTLVGFIKIDSGKVYLAQSLSIGTYYISGIYIAN